MRKKRRITPRTISAKPKSRTRQQITRKVTAAKQVPRLSPGRQPVRGLRSIETKLGARRPPKRVPQRQPGRIAEEIERGAVIRKVPRDIKPVAKPKKKRTITPPRRRRRIRGV